MFALLNILKFPVKMYYDFVQEVFKFDSTAAIAGFTVYQIKILDNK